MGESYFSIEMLREINLAIDEARRIVINSVLAEGCGYRIDTHYSQLKIGIYVDFLFRNETDYSLLIPWEYCNSEKLIREYYRRFLDASEKYELVYEVGACAESFADVELEKLRRGNI